MRLIDETSAIAYQYASQWHRTFSPDEKRIVLFASIGNSKTTFSVVQFQPKSAKVLCSVTDQNFGARNLDQFIAEDFVREFQEQHGVNITKDSDPSAWIKMLNEATGAREHLSIAGEAQVKIDMLT